MRTLHLAAAAALLFPLAVHAQAAVQSGAPTASAARVITIPEGTEVVGVTTETISSKTAAEGDNFVLKVDEDVRVDGVVVIARGAMIRGTVSEAKGAGRMGRGGKLNVKIESTSLVTGDRVHLRASKGKAGDDKTGSTVALTVLFGPIGLLKKGNDAEIKAGTKLTLFTDEVKSITAP